MRQSETRPMHKPADVVVQELLVCIGCEDGKISRIVGIWIWNIIWKKPLLDFCCYTDREKLTWRLLEAEIQLVKQMLAAEPILCSH